jgi:transposase
MTNDANLAIFNAAREEGLGKDDTIMKLVTEGGLSVTQAVRDYQSMAKAAGLILGAAERNKEVNEYLADYTAEDFIEVETRRDIVTAIADRFDVSEATAAAHVRKYCEDNDIELPQIKRTSLEDMVKFVKEMLDSGKTSKEVKTALEEEMGYTANTAASAYSRATRELGLSTGRAAATVPLSETVSFIRTNQGLGRKALARKMADELGYAESTAGAFLTYVNFAKEWAKQEIEG